MDNERHKQPQVRMLRMAVLIGCVVLVSLVLVWARAFYGSRDNFLRAEAFLKGGQTIKAITFYDRSIHWYTPFNPYVENSARRLWEIGEQAQHKGDDKLALIAFETIRSGFYGASHIFTPGKHWVEKADCRLLELGAAGKDVMDPHPNPLWSVVVVIGFLGWIGSVAGFARLVVGRDVRRAPISSRAVSWISLGVFFFGLWIAGMVFA